MKVQKVQIEVVVEIDQEAWEAQFDVSSVPGLTQVERVRYDVRQYAEEIVRGQLDAIGVLVK